MNTFGSMYTNKAQAKMRARERKTLHTLLLSNSTTARDMKNAGYPCATCLYIYHSLTYISSPDLR